MRMLLLSTCQHPALIRMLMADEGVLVPRYLLAHIARGFMGAEIGILVIVGVLPPENNGIIRLSLFGLPLGHIGHISLNGNRIR